MLKIFNTKTRKKEEFVPLKRGHVKMYICGPTVYNAIHIGNARPAIVFDTVRNYLEYQGFEVQYVSNITDVDDKLIEAAKARNVTVPFLAEEYMKMYFSDIEKLGCQKCTCNPKVTENMEDIIIFIQKLLEKNMAYEINGSVYYRTKKFNNYGQLSKQLLDDLQAGSRVSVSGDKEDDLDFVLWKRAKRDEIFWESPWGPGRPGWHIECSTLIKKYLGDTIDIHAGGQDLIFPHHENEIAQSEVITGQPLAQYWMHNGFINFEDEKMSKSLGNVIVLQDLFKKVSPQIIRFFLLSVHYRNPINFSFDLLRQSQLGVDRIKGTILNLNKHYSTSYDRLKDDIEMKSKIINLRERFILAMDDDFNTANAITTLYDLVKLSNLYLLEEETSKEIIQTLKKLFEDFSFVLGISFDRENSINEEVEELILMRTEARKNRDFQKADRIRDDLLQMNIVLEDTSKGTSWRKV